MFLSMLLDYAGSKVPIWLCLFALGLLYTIMPIWAMPSSIFNIVDSKAVDFLWKAFQGFSDWSFPSAKVCQVTWSGLEAHVARYRNSPLMQNVPTSSPGFLTMVSVSLSQSPVPLLTSFDTVEISTLAKVWIWHMSPRLWPQPSPIQSPIGHNPNLMIIEHPDHVLGMCSLIANNIIFETLALHAPTLGQTQHFCLCWFQLRICISGSWQSKNAQEEQTVCRCDRCSLFLFDAVPIAPGRMILCQLLPGWSDHPVACFVEWAGSDMKRSLVQFV